MALIWHEHPESREGSFEFSGGQRLGKYIVQGSSSDVIVRNFALANLPNRDGVGAILSDLSIRPITTGLVDDDFSWQCMPVYSHPATPASLEADSIQLPTGGYDWTWKSDTQTGHVDHAIHQTEYPANLVDDAGMLKRAINVTVDDEVRGVDIPVPQMDLIIWKFFPRALLKGATGIATAKYLSSCCGKTNSAPWWGFERGELRFGGCDPEPRGIQDIKLTYHFQCEANRANIKFGYMIGEGDCTVPLKRGHEYLHIQHRRHKSTDAKEMVPAPKRVMVAQVSEELDFSTLALPNYPPPPGY